MNQSTKFHSKNRLKIEKIEIFNENFQFSRKKLQFWAKIFLRSKHRIFQNFISQSIRPKFLVQKFGINVLKKHFWKKWKFWKFSKFCFFRFFHRKLYFLFSVLLIYWLILKWLKELFILEKRESKVLWPMRIVDFSLSHFLKMKGQIIRIYSIWFRNQTQTKKIRKIIQRKKKKKENFIMVFSREH